MRGRAVTGFHVPLGHIELRLVRDVAHHAGLRAGTEQSALRAFEYFDALEVGGVDVEVARRQLAGLIVQVNGDVREAADGTARLAARGTDAEAAHENVALARAVARRGDVGQILDVVVEGRDAQLIQRFSCQRLNRDGHILDIFRSALGRY